MFGNSIFKNLLFIILTAVVLIVLTLLFLRSYTRHNQNVQVPQLHTLQANEANTILKARGLHMEIIDSIYRRGSVPGAIIEQTPVAKSNVKKGRTIYVTIYSKNPQQISVPGLVDYSSRQAQALLVSMGFTQLDIEEVPSEYDGLVLAVEYHGRTLNPDEKIPAGSPLTLVVGSGELTDSLQVDREYIIPPSEIQRTDSGSIVIEGTPMPNQENNTKQTDLDESFF